ncbi:Alpha/Beta hydrolase protein [Lactarius quietus]|nr:Alpha/Beta hydrolase protein [Lactarius quietus]
MAHHCLTLNVFRPSGIDSLASLPVMRRGQSSLYDGSYFVEQSVARGTPILFVSLNYRVGPLGFPQGPEAVQRDALNLGFTTMGCSRVGAEQHRIFGGDPAKVTLFGESAGALSASHHYLNENFTAVARAAIFQSGLSTLPIFNAYRAIPSWMHFANNTKSCTAPTLSPDNTFYCLMSASSSDLLVGMKAGMAIEPFPFRPVLDGSEGIISGQPVNDWLRCWETSPFMAGTVLDEARADSQNSNDLPATDFQTEDIATWLNANYTPSPFGHGSLRAGIDRVLSLYPDDPVLARRSGRETRHLALDQASSGEARSVQFFTLGDLYFQALRRFWSHTTSAQGTPSYAYIFTDPSQMLTQRSECSILVNSLLIWGHEQNGPPKSARLSRTMLDYWISFAVSLTPNDGKGTIRPHWEVYKKAKRVLELNGSDVRLVPDNYRAFSMDFIIKMREMWSW